MKTFGWSPDFVMFELTSAQGWCWYNWALENELTAFGAVAERAGEGYIAQERNARLGNKDDAIIRKS